MRWSGEAGDWAQYAAGWNDAMGRVKEKQDAVRDTNAHGTGVVAADSGGQTVDMVSPDPQVEDTVRDEHQPTDEKTWANHRRCTCGESFHTLLPGRDFEAHVQDVMSRKGKPDMVNHPPHYKQSWGEVIDVTENFNFNMGNALKYILRADEKGNPLEDLKKAKWYVSREIRRREKKG